MKRRTFIGRLVGAILASCLKNYFGLTMGLVNSSAQANATDAQPSSAVDSVLAGTRPLTAEGDLALQMVEVIRQFLLAQTERQAMERESRWSRDYGSAQNYERSVAPNQQRFRQIIGAIDERITSRPPEIEASIGSRTAIAQASTYSIYAVRWRVLAPVTPDSQGLEALGLLLEPHAAPTARVVAIPDADWSPEMLVGVAPGIPSGAQFARTLAENGVQVIVPLVISRDDRFSGIPGIGMTNMPHREWIYRMGFECGRHIIGLEVQKILAAVDWFEGENTRLPLSIGVMGYGEGGLLALYSAAIDTRIAATLVSGYFQPRDDVWKEPIYRDVWGLITEFGDAELAGLIAPRTLVVEASRCPEVPGPPPASADRRPVACPNGILTTPPLEAVQREIERARPIFRALHAEHRLQLIAGQDGNGLPCSLPAIHEFLHGLGIQDKPQSSGAEPPKLDPAYDSSLNMRSQFNNLVEYVQAVIRKSPDVRKEFWSKADESSIQSWRATTDYYRKYIWDEVIGRMPAPSLPPDPRTRATFETPRFRGYEVMLNVWPDVFAYGILLLPKDLKIGERRPTVVCQHGLDGRSVDVADPKIDNHFYHQFAATLAEEGFVVYAPQNPYIGDDMFRIIQRLAHPLKLSLFSVILGQHEQMLNWLSEQPFVDPDRIGFYGLSYGGKTAVRVPPLLDRYALSICSGDFNEWVWKTTTVLAPQSYLLTKEYDMYEFNFANVVNYSNLGNLMAPRPFMVERGHDDPVGVDEWVAFEYAKVREFYDKMNLGDQTEIEFFNGPHEIHGKGTFKFLRKHLHWNE